MARYLQAVIGGEPGVVRVLVFGDNIRVVRAGIRPTIVLPVPRAISAFVRGFDAGCFPDLVDSSRRPPSGQSAPVGEP
jgi:hypothetical protein